jgi:protein-S-isoprenylcysteine O-methyltransferase Ste14
MSCYLPERWWPLLLNLLFFLAKSLPSYVRRFVCSKRICRKTGRRAMRCARMLRGQLHLGKLGPKGKTKMKWLDLPPVWLLGCLVLTWVSPWALPWGGAVVPGVIFLAIAAILTMAALASFLSARTTFVPRKRPDALITSGVFRYTRNPIYLADLLIMAGFTLLWGRLLGLILVPCLLILLDRRFIRGEERRLREAFGEAFDTYASETRRWL